jgi:pyruvate/2-oxoglutarate dehydrogenase complex dihydrolipoamide dehydrogenase (E3) component
VIERRDLGGTCVNNGCIPTKTLVGERARAHSRRRGGEYGFSAGECGRHGAVKARKDRSSATPRNGLATWIGAMKNVTLVRGHARFTGPRHVDVGGRTLHGGADLRQRRRPRAGPAIPGLADVPYLTNVDVMDVDFRARAPVIVGGSYIGLEFAQMYRRFGSKVTVIERAPKLLPREDDDVAAEIRAILEREGVKIVTDAECISFGRRGDDITVGLSAAARIRSRRQPRAARDRRVPNTQDLGLEKAGVQVDARGLHHGRRPCRTTSRNLGAGRCQRPRRLHPYVVQRLRDRRRQPLRQRRARISQRIPPTRSSSIRRSAASA